MNNEAVIVFLILCIVLLIGAVIGQKAVLQARINRVNGLPFPQHLERRAKNHE